MNILFIIHFSAFMKISQYICLRLTFRPIAFQKSPAPKNTNNSIMKKITNTYQTTGCISFTQKQMPRNQSPSGFQLIESTTLAFQMNYTGSI